MLLRLKIVVGVHSVVLPVPVRGGFGHGACYAALEPCWRRSRRPALAAAGGLVTRRPRSATVVMALKEEPEGSRRGFVGSGSSWDPGLEIQVPSDPFLLWIRKESLNVGDHIYSWKATCFLSFQVVDAKVIHLGYNNSCIFLSLKDVKVMVETTLGKEELKEAVLMCTNRVS
ncbi:hypothetical protein ZEAMMB73_Zm00001d042048 [Zea mays]|uniref:Uncharacterized protein n=1 Tax=Zea mays TaxID=4577 RepID=A0A1D6N0R0_MAIZE|nr:hypothetical protein ZEAMMB73_Zm00001d042048 [Zea mays]